MRLTPQQELAVSSSCRSICVEAGAGSGKTRVLVERIVHLLEQPAKTALERIVAITFTDKAAAEMKERLRTAFRQRAPHTDSEQMSYWRDLERRVDGARISTIHSFCATLLRENALTLGMDPDFAVLAEGESLLLRVDVIERALHGLLEKGDPGARAVAREYGMGPLATIMSAFLKQRGLMQRIQEEWSFGDPDALLCQWSDAYKQEKERRLLEWAQSPELREWHDTFSKFNGECENSDDPREKFRVAILDGIAKVQSGVSAAVIEDVIKSLNDFSTRGTKKQNWDIVEDAERLANLEKQFVDSLPMEWLKEIDPDLERLAAKCACELVAAYNAVAKEFEDAKAAGPTLDFDDLILRTAAMLRHHRDIRQRVAAGIDHLLVDEFQDTDNWQLAIVNLLADCDSGGPSLFIVGDAKQSIYRFRGAEVETFQTAKTASAERLPLSQNFRSVPNVLGFVNDLFASSGLLRAVEEQYRPLDVVRAASDDGRIEFLIPKEPKEQEKATLDDYRREEAELIAARIKKLCDGTGPRVLDPTTRLLRPAKYGDVAILFRALSDVHLYERSLREHDVPYTLVSGPGYFARQEVMDFCNLLAVVIDPYDEMALLGFLRSPIAGLSDDALLTLCSDTSLTQAFRGDTPVRFPEADHLETARSIVTDLRDHGALPLGEFLRRVLDVTGYQAILLPQFMGKQKALNVRKILDLADDFGKSSPPTLSAFLRYLDEVKDKELREGEAVMQAEGANAVTIMTVHKAKGLEFPIVVVPDMSRGLPPGSNTSAAAHRRWGLAATITGMAGETVAPSIMTCISAAVKEEEKAEHARVLYVALTRARDYLVLGGAPKSAGANDSWMGVMEDWAGVCGKADEDVIHGNGWQAVVLRSLESASGATSSSTDSEATERPTHHGATDHATSILTKEELLRRVGPVSESRSRRRTLAVTTALHIEEEESDAGTEKWAPESAPLIPGRADPRLRGTLIHRLFEIWDFQSPAEPYVEAILRQEAPSISLRGVLRDDLLLVARHCADTPLGRRMAGDPAIQREAPFLLRVGDTLLSGTIDAVLGDGAIVDYKTGTRRPESHARYERQLQLYAAALRQLRQVNAPAALLWYVDSGEVHDVDVSEERINNVLQDAAGVVADAGIVIDSDGSDRSDRSDRSDGSHRSDQEAAAK